MRTAKGTANKRMDIFITIAMLLTDPTHSQSPAGRPDRFHPSVPARIHFGLGNLAANDLLYLEKVWSDGKISHIDQPPPSRDIARDTATAS